MGSWSLYVGKFFDIKVFIHWTFWIVVGWIFLMHWQGGTAIGQGIRGVFFILALFLCVVLHEFGHALTARRFGVVTKDITLYPIGGVASLVEMPEKPWQEFLVAVSGPAVSFAIGAVLWIVLTVTGQMPASFGSNDIFKMPFLFGLMVANIALAIFNLIPAFPMDGGRAFRALLSFVMDKTLATRIAAGLGQLLAIVFVFLGFFYNFWLIFIGLFIFLGAGGESSLQRLKSSLKDLKVKDALMHSFTVLSSSDTLGGAVDALLNSRETEFVVADEGKPVGILSKNKIIQGLSEQGKEAPVTDFMDTDFFVVHPETDLPKFFQQVLEKGQTLALVMDGEKLLGLIDRENVEEKILIREALKNRGE